MRLVKFVGRMANDQQDHEFHINPGHVRYVEKIQGGTAIYLVERGEKALIVTGSPDVVANELNGGLLTR